MARGQDIGDGEGKEVGEGKGGVARVARSEMALRECEARATRDGVERVAWGARCRGERGEMALRERRWNTMAW